VPIAPNSTIPLELHPLVIEPLLAFRGMHADLQGEPSVLLPQLRRPRRQAVHLRPVNVTAI